MQTNLTFPARVVFGAALVVTVSTATLLGGRIGENRRLSSGTGAAFPDVAYCSSTQTYLVAYTDYGISPLRILGRLVGSDGIPLGAEFAISENTALFAAVAANDRDGEFLVVWDDQRQSPYAVWGQRIRATDGARLGSNFQIGDSGSVRASAVAWGSTDGRYLVVWRRSDAETVGRLISATGQRIGAADVNISNDAEPSLYPTVEYGPSGNRFLVTWDCDEGNNRGTIRGRCVNAADAGAAGGIIQITSVGREIRSHIAYAPAAGSESARWLVQFNQDNPGFISDQYGRFVDAECSAIGSLFPVANTTIFEGETHFGGDITFVHGRARYLAVFQVWDPVTDLSGINAQELDRNGNRCGAQVPLSVGNDGGLSNAADPDHHRFLTVWSRAAGGVMCQLYEPMGPSLNLVAAPASQAIRLTWTNPSTPDFAATRIIYKPTAYPTGPTDGRLIADKPGTPGSADEFLHVGLTPGEPAFYAAFAHNADAGPPFADAALADGIPAAPGDFDADGDVDQADFGALQMCFTGDALLAEPCIEKDLDGDLRVDGQDVNLFRECMGGAGRPPGC